jgi:hypothetical protein
MACATRAIERAESRPADPSKPKQNAATALLYCSLGLLVCLVGFIVGATANIWLVAAFAVAAYISAQIIRHFGLANWATAVLLATLVIAAAMIIFWRYNATAALSPVLQFATSASPTAISVARRILADASWFGTGAGTYAQLVPIYQGLDTPSTTPPSTAAAFAIELGWPMMLFVFLLGIGTFVALYRGALIRGRDSFYPAAAAACTMILLLQAFCDASLLRTGIAVLADAIIGLGLAQSVSRSDGG